ncbi:unnamed protein product [Caenorhabditis auriculariae]|uniref:Uncharacterized protein n=1 Tax=Caenorhabditis auriculariae TaxID=2777116 RepID=A0A8S1GXR3_9PELO|nr:unnamed protein product [Caenorhabditis auriculariae]
MCVGKRKISYQAAETTNDATPAALHPSATPTEAATPMAATPRQPSLPPQPVPENKPSETREVDNEKKFDNETRNKKSKKQKLPSNKSIGSSIPPPKIRKARRSPEGLKDAKDPQYATLDGDYPSFALAAIDRTPKSVKNKAAVTPKENETQLSAVKSKNEGGNLERR